MSTNEDTPRDAPIASSSSSRTQPNSLKRKRQILPLGDPPPQQVQPVHPQERTVLRVNRACNTCRRQKMRCDGPDKGTACTRCQNSSVECVFEKMPANKPPTIPTTSRLSSLEEKMELLQAAQSQMQDSLAQILAELRRSNAPSQTPAIPMAQNHTPDATSSQISGSSTQFKQPPSKNHGDPDSTDTISSPYQTLLSPCQTPSDRSVRTPSIMNHDLQTSSRALKPLPPIDTEGIISPYDKGAVNSEEVTTPRTTGNMQLEACDEGSYIHQTTKRSRLDARQVLREDGCRPWNPVDPVKEFRAEDTTYPDSVARGLLNEATARELFRLFFDWCHPRMPIFDPRVDTFNSLRDRSPFCFCCVLMVAVTARDGSQPSSLQNALWEESMRRAKESMFQRVKDLEVIQSLILLSAWSESTGGTCWIVLGHAIRCGVEMGIHKALQRLSVGPPLEDEKTQVLVNSARLWCALFAFEHQLSFGIGRHSMTGSSRSVKSAREILLNHPLSQPSDMRLVSACEILVMEYETLDTIPSPDPTDPRSVTHFSKALEKMHQWEREWMDLLTPHFSPEDYMFQTVNIQKNFGIMIVFMAGIPHFLTAADVGNVSEQEKYNGTLAVSAAREILRISVEESSYRDGLRYSPTCFYSGVAFVGALVLRMGNIVLSEEPESLHDDAVRLYHVLQDVPTCRFKFSFLSLLKEKNLIPQDVASS